MTRDEHSSPRKVCPARGLRLRLQQLLRPRLRLLRQLLTPSTGRVMPLARWAVSVGAATLPG
ncbi:hypothetical protein [Actinokineospora sp. UTMC 2448]|uniref:hypothetical protein n=1 Tax=Actinokineospora sp. UTMC 2448 TaxID=2268449 RepID=UPI0021644820|nr:hypothetical protein [Actinokineospora sp. UTMC 2448]